MNVKLKTKTKIKCKFLCNRIVCGILFSVVFSFFLMILNYYWTNKQIAESSEIELITNLRTCIYKWLPKRQVEFNDVLFIDVSNDLELIDVFDKYEDKIGNIAIIDRKKITQLISLLKDNDIIYLGIEFDSMYRSKNDSILNKEISKKKNLILPYILTQGEIRKPFITSSKIGMSAYWSSIKSNRFLKYEFISNDTIKSVALLIHEILTGKTIKKKGLFYYSDGNICINNTVTNIKIRPSDLISKNGVTKYKKLGYDILDFNRDKESLSKNINDRIIMIGDFESFDLHSTIYGNIPGTLINYNAYLTLKENKHIIPTSLIWLIFFFYSVISLIVFLGYDKVLYRKFFKLLLKNKMIKNVHSFITKHYLRNIVVKFTEKIITLTFAFSFFSILIMVIYNIYISILLSSSIFVSLILIRDVLFKKLNFDT